MIAMIFVSDTRVSSLTIEYKEPEYEAWQFLAEFLSRYPTDNLGSLEMVVEQKTRSCTGFSRTWMASWTRTTSSTWST